MTQTGRNGLNSRQKPKEKESRHLLALTIEECKPNRDYRIGSFAPLPSNVSFERVVTHVIDSFKNAIHTTNNQKVSEIKKGFKQRKLEASYVYIGKGRGSIFVTPEITSALLDQKEDAIITKFGEEEDKQMRKFERKLKIWQNYLYLPENQAIVSDAFWYTRYMLIPEEDSDKIKEFLINRMSKNYVSYFVSVEGPQKDNFFKVREY